MRKTCLRTITCAGLFLWLIAPLKIAHAQSTSITEAHLNLDSLAPATVACTFIVSLSDSQNVSQVEVALGGSPGDSSLVFHVFDFDVITGVPPGFSYQREGRRLTLTTGNADRHPTWFGQVRVKDSQNGWSSPKMFVRN